MKDIKISFIVDKESTIGDYLLLKGLGSTLFQQIKSRLVLLNGAPVRDKNIVVKLGDTIDVKLLPEKNDLPLNTDEIDPLYEDQYLLLVNKPANLLVEPYKKNTSNNLASMVANYFEKEDVCSKVHLVNRLDRCTSGIVIIAKNGYIHNLMKKSEIIKKYHAIVEGKTPESGVIKININKEDFSNSRIVAESGKEAITKYETISYDEKNNSSLVDVQILTGRTHQIRLSFSSIGHPLLGDSQYGSSKKEDVSLCAYYISFTHPITGSKIEIKLD